MKAFFWLDKIPSFGARCLAYLVDYSLFYLLFSLASLVFPYYIEDLYYVGFALALPFLWIPVEAFLISRFKTTPGRALWGIRVETHLGGRLSYLVSLKRACFLGTRPGCIRQRAISFVRKAFAVVTLIALLQVSYFEKEIAVITTGFEKYKTIEGWKEYSSSEGGFRVLFPQEPECESKVLPVPSQNRNLSYNELKSYQTQKVYYSISYIELPRRWKMAGASRLLNGALDLIVEHTAGAKLLEKNMTKHKNLRAMDFHLSQGEEEVQGRLILVGTTLFRLSVVYPPSLAHQLQKTEFLNSFEVQG